MIILAISGSLRKGSSNTSILHRLRSFAPAGVEFLIYENIGSLPHFNPDLNQENDLPLAVKELREMLERASALLISTPEYAHGIPGSLKNALDWFVSTVLLENKPCGIVMGSSSDGAYARDALIETLKTMNAKVFPQLVIAISGVRARVDDPKTSQDLKEFVERFVSLAQKPS